VNNLTRSLPDNATSGVELATSRSQVRRPATTLLNHVVVVVVVVVVIVVFVVAVVLVIVVIIRKNKVNVPVVDFWDTAGQERFSSMHPSYYHQAHACILVSLLSVTSIDINLYKIFNAVKPAAGAGGHIGMLIKCFLSRKQSVLFMVLLNVVWPDQQCFCSVCLCMFPYFLQYLDAVGWVF